MDNKSQSFNESYIIEPDEMSLILWLLEGKYKEASKDKTEFGKKAYTRCKSLHERLSKEFMNK